MTTDDRDSSRCRREQTGQTHQFSVRLTLHAIKPEPNTETVSAIQSYRGLTGVRLTLVAQLYPL